MFRNIGGKIKVLVIVAAVLCILACIAYGAIIIIYSLLGEKMLAFLSFTGLDKAVLNITAGKTGAIGVASGIVVMVAGSLLVYLAAFIPYGFGQLIQNTDRMVKSLDSAKSTLSKLHTHQTESANYQYYCPVYFDEYGRPCYAVPEDMFYQQEDLADGDLVPTEPAGYTTAEQPDTDTNPPQAPTDAAKEQPPEDLPEKSANQIMDELIRTHSERKGQGKHKNNEKTKKHTSARQQYPTPDENTADTQNKE